MDLTKKILLVGILTIFTFSFLQSVSFSPVAETLLPVKNSSREALFQGKLTFLGSGETFVRFAYGENRENLDNFTEWKNKDSLVEFNELVGGFLPNKMYYFRAEAKSEENFGYGRIISFMFTEEIEGDFKGRVSGEVLGIKIKIKDNNEEVMVALEDDTEFFINPISERRARIEEIRKKDSSCDAIPQEIFEDYRLRVAQIGDINKEDKVVMFFKQEDGDFFVDKIVIER